jgi:hypothetical protein
MLGMPTSAPLIILCPPRSFSSVICAMLGQHPQLYGFPELNLFSAETVDELLRLEEQPTAPDIAAATHTAGLCRALAEVSFGEQTPAALDRTRTWLLTHRHWPTRQVFGLLLSQIEPRRGVDKSPRTAASPLHLRRALTHFPEARFLHLTRHPVTAVRSLLHAHRLGPAPAPAGPIARSGHADFCGRFWCFVHESILEFTHSLPPSQTMRVRGEDLLNMPALHLPSLAEWLGVRADDCAVAAMQHPERSPYAGIGPGPIWAENDPKFLHAPQLRTAALPATVEPPPEWDLSPALQRTLQRLADKLGYAGSGHGPLA